jgi:hypothetical protein
LCISTGTEEIFGSIQGKPSFDFVILELSYEMTNFSVTNDGKLFILRVECKVGGSVRIKVVILAFAGITVF